MLKNIEIDKIKVNDFVELKETLLGGDDFHISGSNIKDLFLSDSRYNKLIERKLGVQPEGPKGIPPAVAHAFSEGHKGEPIILEWFKNHLGGERMRTDWGTIKSDTLKITANFDATYIDDHTKTIGVIDAKNYRQLAPSKIEKEMQYQLDFYMAILYLTNSYYVNAGYKIKSMLCIREHFQKYDLNTGTYCEPTAPFKLYSVVKDFDMEISNIILNRVQSFFSEVESKRGF